MHSERPVPQIKTERRAMLLIRLIVEAYLKGGGGGDWRFCLLASSILVDIAKNNVTKGNFIDLVVRSAISFFLGGGGVNGCFYPENR